MWMTHCQLEAGKTSSLNFIRVDLAFVLEVVFVCVFTAQPTASGAQVVVRTLF